MSSAPQMLNRRKVKAFIRLDIYLLLYFVALARDERQKEDIGYWQKGKGSR